MSDLRNENQWTCTCSSINLLWVDVCPTCHSLMPQKEVRRIYREELRAQKEKYGKRGNVKRQTRMDAVNAFLCKMQGWTFPVTLAMLAFVVLLELNHNPLMPENALRHAQDLAIRSYAVFERGIPGGGRLYETVEALIEKGKDKHIAEEKTEAIREKIEGVKDHVSGFIK
ncbi:MAG: hypothetical protein MJ114_00645 [Acetatifactor sp.]|nr:hypothetical protein [Acetatifactor sp.]